MQSQFLPGIAIEGQVSLSNQELIDFLVKATIAANLGLLVVQTTAPDVVANPDFTRYTWADTTSFTLKRWNGAAWVAWGEGAISSATQITDHIITLAKLDITGGAAKKLLRINAANTSVEFIPLSTVLEDDSVPLASLDNSLAPADSLLRSQAGVTSFVNLATIAAAVVATITTMDPNVISGKVNLSLLAVDGASVAAYKTYAQIFSAAGLCPNHTIEINKLLATGGVANDIIVFDGTNFVLRQNPTLIKEVAITDSATLVKTDTDVAIAHTLTGRPKLLRCVLVCIIDDLGFVTGDEINVESVHRSDGGPSMTIYTTAAAVHYIHNQILSNGTEGDYIVTDVTSPATDEALTSTKWKFKFYAYA